MTLVDIASGRVRSSRVPNSSSKKIKPSGRFFVPDLSPEAHSELKVVPMKWIFVAESPHVQEVEPPAVQERRPLCGAAGRQWWGLLRELLESRPQKGGKASGSPTLSKAASRTQEASDVQDLSLVALLSFCQVHRMVVMNAVQYPMDPKVAQKFPEADPAVNLGFNKVSGAFSFKKKKDSPEVLDAFLSLQKRLAHPSVAGLPVYSLGNDSEWWVSRALESLGQASRYRGKIPHPSAWWRRGGAFGRVAREELIKIFSEAR